MTQQYLIGELSARLEHLQASTTPAAARAVADLRRQVENRPVTWLAPGGGARPKSRRANGPCIAGKARMDENSFAAVVRVRLEPRSEVVQLVAFDGEHLGHVRRETGPGHGRQWVAVLKDRARRIGSYPTAAAAAEALSSACGRSAERAD
jgi:hypothetical protein